MYDREFVKLTITSPFTSTLNHEVARKELVDGYRCGVRSAIVAPGQVDMLNEVKADYDNGYSRTGMAISYPYGGFSTNFKVYLARQAKEKGLDEIDVGFNVTAAVSGDFDTIRKELELILEAVDGQVRVVPMLWMVKLPFETIDKLCQLYIDLGITAVKTSAGIHFGYMKLEHIQYLYRNYGDKLCIEVAGKVRARSLAEEMYQAGASYFHMGSWRSVSGIGKDVGFDPVTKEITPGEG